MTIYKLNSVINDMRSIVHFDDLADVLLEHDPRSLRQNLVRISFVQDDVDVTLVKRVEEDNCE